MAWINLTFFAEEKDIDLLSEELESSGALSIFIPVSYTHLTLPTNREV